MPTHDPNRTPLTIRYTANTYLAVSQAFCAVLNILTKNITSRVIQNLFLSAVVVGNRYKSSLEKLER